jgi:VWFA-related protein
VLVAFLSLSTARGLADTQSVKDGPPSTFKTGVTQMEVAVVVRDHLGTFVRDLQTQDIELYEDKVRQDIANLIRVDVPTSSDEHVARVALRPASIIAPADRRVYLVVLDDLQISPEHTDATRRAVSKFIQRSLAPTDLVGVVFTSGVKNGTSDFTADHKQLLTVIGTFAGRKELVTARREDPRAEYAAWQAAQAREFQTSSSSDGLGSAGSSRGAGQQGMSGQSQQMDAGKFQGMAEFQRRVMDPGQSAQDANVARQALVSMDTLRRLADAMGRISLPRKSILYFSQGLDYDVDDVTGRTSTSASSVRAAMQAAISLATRNNVAFYAFDPRGVVMNEVGYGAKQDNANARALRCLQQLATETGGFAATGSNDLTAAYDRLVQENSQYYVVGYYPAKPKDDGKFHKIEVRIRGRSDVSVVTRRGYFAVDGKRERKEQREREKLERKARKQNPAANVATADPGASPGAVAGVSPAANPATSPTPVQTIATSSPAALVAPPTADEPHASTNPESPATAATTSSTASAAAAASEASTASPSSPSSPALSAQTMEADNAKQTAAMTAQLADLLGSSVVTPGMALRLKSVSFDESGQKTAVYVHVVVDGGVPFREYDKRFTNVVVSGLTALDQQGLAAGTTQAVLSLNLSPKEAEAIRKTNTGWALRFDIDPGRYHVRVAAAESVGGQKGSLFFDVDVPNFRGDMTVNALIVKSQSHTRGLSSSAGPMDARGVPMVGSATNSYTQRDTLRASAEIYARKPQPTIVTTKLLTAAGAIVMEFTEDFAAKDFHERVCYAYKTLPLASLDPGPYILRYEARPTNDSLPMVVRDVKFSVTGEETQTAARP